MSTFHGLEMAKQALFAQQSALYTTGHNISNANTKGYTRQRVNFETMNPYPAAARNRPELPGQMGTGVQTGSIQRVRDSYLDVQFRAENSKSGYWSTMSDALTRLEGVMNEPSDSGLSKTMGQFWQSIQDLSSNPENSGARSVVAQRGKAVADTFNYLSESLTSIQSDLKNQMDITVTDANSLLNQIHNINQQVNELEPHGYLPNDLYDERDRLIDELSSIVNIKVDYDKSSPSSKDIAQGIASIEIVDDKGNSFEPAVKLLDGSKADAADAIQKLSIDYNEGEVMIGNNSVDISKSNGSLKGLADAYGLSEDGSGLYRDMLADLDKMATNFAEQFNKVHQQGVGLDGSNGLDFFTFKPGTSGAGGLTVNKDILDHPDKIAASSNGNAGNGDNASNLANVFDDTKIVDDNGNNPFGENTSINSFYQSLIGEMGVQAQEAKRMENNTGVLRLQVENQRMSVSSVSLDEEMSNMIKFQHAYNAAARSMTAMDEMLDKIINSMGLVGR
ncbi:flagellar hook-associated protein FlgK [Virgibacillus halodenitrificans]|uniref:Flagellar hook-associated protein 1 n=1 Tax=Virgibacillus halodenitrificans TaxID=1482 RepID=A0ABR7VRN0_VIRHA|nr:flagellar hook-associated protein FlgK [Virgibacillus halodenitrificans]MBD1223207.1 flagellar hook-associated protein FlgK [Virgibacillus halodenitrificans]